MVKKLLLVIFIAGIGINSKACLNLFTIDATGNVHMLEHYFFSEIRFNTSAVSKTINKLEKKLKSGKFDYKEVSDYGAYLLMAGKFKEGLQIFTGLASKYPDDYKVNANCAVAYELNGNIDSAIYFEKRSMALNSYGHEGSEWIHLKILEAKKQVATDPDWCFKNNVSGIMDSLKAQAGQPAMEVEINIFRPFILQLKERLPFTYAEDKVMGKLLFEMGNAYQYFSAFRAYYCYSLAKHLYPALATSADKKMANIKKVYTANSGKLPLSRPIGVMEINDETKPPDDDEVAKFIETLISRPVLTNNRKRTISPSYLVNKL